MPGAKRLRQRTVVGGLGAMLAAAVVFAKSGCGPSEPFLAGGDPWATYLVSLLFVFLAWGALASDALGHLFLRWGWEPDFRPIRISAEGSDTEFTPAEKKWVAYPILAITGAVGFWHWIGVNGCDVVVVPMRGIAS